MENRTPAPCRDGLLLLPGIQLFYRAAPRDLSSPGQDGAGPFLRVDYCRSGQAVWQGGGKRLSLSPGDFLVCTPGASAALALAFPTGAYRGLTLLYHRGQLDARPPELLRDTGVLRCLPPAGPEPLLLRNSPESDGIFAGFYDQPEELRLARQRLSALELLLLLARREPCREASAPPCPLEQAEIIREIHDRLTRQMEQRLTIEALSREYLINPTTLKAAFKAVYGTSIAAHVRAHRMEEAARLLRSSDQSIAEIAQAVGYDSQSRFTAAFKACFGVLPKEYRRGG